MAKTKVLSTIALVFSIFVVTSTFAQMGGGMGGGGGPMGGYHGGGMGYGIHGSGGMVSGMWGNTMSHGYRKILNPITAPADARTAIEAFIDASNSNLQISELWEYETRLQGRTF